jgi:hypothetical protein
MRGKLAYTGTVSEKSKLAEMRKRGGENRWRGITPERRSELARKAALARWGKRK